MDEASFKAVVSGERRGLAASFMRSLLAAASAPYGLGIRLRNAAFDLGWNRTLSAGVPVISVGNVTTGGTGKTPFVAFVVDWLLLHGHRPAILSRGYRSLDGAANDEKRVLDRLCPGVPHIQNRDRVAGARAAIQEHQADALVLDDGFQHRRIARDLDIVLVDALNPWGFGRLLPRGLLREPLIGLRRAGLIALTRAERLTAESRTSIQRTIAQSGSTARILEVAFTPSHLVDLAGATTPIASFSRKPLAAFCGIGNPDGFRATLAAAGLEAAAFLTFPDHHHYAAPDFARIGDLAASRGVAALVTTEKDLVKIPEPALRGIPVYAVRIAAEIRAGADSLDAALRTALDSAAAPRSLPGGRKASD